jgi:hypothetical protein
MYNKYSRLTEIHRQQACTIGTVLLVRSLANFLRFLRRVFECHEG